MEGRVGYVQAVDGYGQFCPVAKTSEVLCEHGAADHP